MAKTILAVGIAEATAFTQDFLEMCEAVRTVYELGDKYFAFTYDTTVEVHDSPENVWFDAEQAPDEAQKLLNK